MMEKNISLGGRRIYHSVDNLKVLNLLKKNFNLAQIAKELNIKQSNLSRAMKPLKAKGIIQRIGYGVWKVKENNISLGGDPLSEVVGGFKKEVRGHGFQWIIRLPKKLKFEEREQLLTKASIDHRPLRQHGKLYAQSFKFKGYQMRFTEKSIIIWQPKELSWFAQKAPQARAKAVMEFRDKVLKGLEALIGRSFTYNGQYRLKIASNHYSLVENELAKQYNTTKKQLFVADQTGQWLIIDNSFNLNELETVHPVTAVTDNIKVQNFFNSLKQEPFTAYDFKEMYNVSKEYMENLKLHLSVMREMKDTMKEMRDTIKGGQ